MTQDQWEARIVAALTSVNLRAPASGDNMAHAWALIIDGLEKTATVTIAARKALTDWRAHAPDCAFARRFDAPCDCALADLFTTIRTLEPKP